MLYALARPALFALDAERAHRLTIAALRLRGALGGGPARGTPVTIAGLTFPNRVGLAAGMDKDGEAIAGLFGLGFGAVEVGTLTPLPQDGNPKPRLFRLREEEGVVNRMGFNNGGIIAALARIASVKRTGVLGINVGANKDSADRVADYALGVRKASALADYITINVSSPNTPGLRDLQARPALDELLAACRAETRRPLFLKVAPDLDRAAADGIARAAIDAGVDALIVSNTTITRPATLRSANAREAGGLSGKPLAPLARAALALFREATGGRLPLISAGGIDSADEARARLEAGASMVQLYSALVYRGPGLVRAIVRGIG